MFFVSILVFALLFGVIDPNPNRASCCNKKTVGGVAYTLIGQEDTHSYGCLDDCVYKRDDKEGSKICFSPGDMQPTCSTESNPGFSSSHQVFEFEGCCKHMGIGDRTYLNIPSENSTGCEDSCYYQQVGDFNNKHCLAPGDQTSCLSYEESCANEAISLGMTGCKEDCIDESSSACNNCFQTNLDCVQRLSFPWKCLLPGPMYCATKCLAKHGTHFLEVAKCTKNCLEAQYSECIQYACKILGKFNSQAGSICGCTTSIPPTIKKCKAEKSGLIPTVLCVFEGLFLSPCTEVVCNLLADAIENPELAPLCNCGVGILKNLDTCHTKYSNDWKKLIACVFTGTLLDCKKYACQFVANVFPEIEEFCPKADENYQIDESLLLEESSESTKWSAKGWGGK